MRPEGPRDAVAGPDSGPEPPLPIKLSGPVITGFGRGSKEVRKIFLYFHGFEHYLFVFCYWYNGISSMLLMDICLPLGLRWRNPSSSFVVSPQV